METKAFGQLLSWAGNRPVWQQDALRRLAKQGELTEDDFSALRFQIEAAEGLTEEQPPEAVPLATEHLSEASSNAPKTVLAALGPVSHVDRLESGQPPIRFAVNGVTVIYGPNASGKSGYCRIAKQLCRSLSPVNLRGNVYDGVESPPAEVGVAFRVGNEDNQKRELTWKGNAPPPPELARISVFDTATARVYVDNKRTIQFLPYELDLLNNLGLVTRTLGNRFKERETTLNIAIKTPLPTGYTEGTTAYLLTTKLVPETKLAGLSSEQDLRDLAAWCEVDQAELDCLIEQSKNDPETMTRLREEAHQALQSLKGDISNIEAKLDDSAIETLFRKQQDAVAKNRVATSSAHDLFKDEPIPDVGSEIWRQMLRYARDFAAEAFPDSDLPQISTAGICALCQQDLDSAAALRLAAFDSYLTNRAADEAAVSKRAFDAAVVGIKAHAVKTRKEASSMLAGYAALSEHRKEHAAKIGNFFDKAAERLKSVKQIIDDETYDGLGHLDSLPDSPAQLIEAEISELDDEVKTIASMTREDETVRLRSKQIAELTDRKKLSEEIDIIVERRNKLDERLRVIACCSRCKLTAITQQITKRRREILTPSLQEALEDELKALDLTHIPLNLADRGVDGDSVVEVALSAQQCIPNNSAILSEGEQRGVALACFLAELNEIGRDHGIIVDDPVSSLDQSRMEAVAKRLAKEAKNGRQVIVFTHDIVFHDMLSTEARLHGVACHEEWMTSLGNDRFGIIDKSQKPGPFKPVNVRIQEIDQARQALDASGYDRSDETFRDKVTDLYTNMRMTWERVVEEILFNKAVQRFRQEIMTQRLEAACFDTENDYPLIFEGMKRTSKYSGHDLADRIPPELPSLKDIDQDIGGLQNFVNTARTRRNKLEKSMKKYEDGIEAVLL